MKNNTEKLIEAINELEFEKNCLLKSDYTNNVNEIIYKAKKLARFIKRIALFEYALKGHKFNYILASKEKVEGGFFFVKTAKELAVKCSSLKNSGGINEYKKLKLNMA